MAVDLNADVGEGMDDGALLPYLTSANVACGLHAGDPTVMDRTVAAAPSTPATGENSVYRIAPDGGVRRPPVG